MEFKEFIKQLKAEIDCMNTNPRLYFYIENYGIKAEVKEIKAFSEKAIDITLIAEEV